MGILWRYTSFFSGQQDIEAHRIEDLRRMRGRWFLDVLTPVFKMFPGTAQEVAHDICPMCHKSIGAFRDELSKKEYSISGLCQVCQDKVFYG